jgi:hypothetical protein
MNLCRVRRAAVCAAIVMAMLPARDVRAQTSPVPPPTRVFVAGPVSLYPQIALRDAGTDSNVFNETTNPKSDVIYSLTPRLYAVVPVGNTRFIGTGTGDLVYFRTYSEQRSLTTKLDGRYEVTSPGFRPYASAALVSRGDRDGFEIDARVRHTQTSVTAGTDVDLGPLTALTGWVSRSWTTYGENAQYVSVMLADQLNHEADAVAGGARFRVTPLTTVMMVARYEQIRFTRVPLRDADSLRAESTVAFDTGAAITGDLQAGFMSFSPRNTAIAPYRGPVGSARLHYAIPDLLRVDLDAKRDVDFSYDPIQPYYLESGARITGGQRLIGPLELIAIGERREIRNQRIGGSSFDGRREVITSLGGGLGLQLQDQTRLTFTYERTKRTSTEMAARNYERTRVLASISYGI